MEWRDVPQACQCLLLELYNLRDSPSWISIREVNRDALDRTAIDVCLGEEWIAYDESPDDEHVWIMLRPAGLALVSRHALQSRKQATSPEPQPIGAKVAPIHEGLPQPSAPSAMVEPPATASRPLGGEPEPQAGGRDQEIRLAPDFSSLRVAGATFHFTTPLQRAVIAALFAEWKRAGEVDGCGLTVAALSEAVAEDRASRRERLRIDKLFKSHRAFGTVIRKNGRNVWALHLKGPEKAQS